MAFFTFIIALLLTTAVQANMYDVILPHYIPSTKCANGCAPWNAISSNDTTQAFFDKLWADEQPPADAGSACAMPARPTGVDAGSAEKNPALWNQTIYRSFAGPWCVCAGAPPDAVMDSLHYCDPPFGVPEQLNLQLAKQDAVIASFVTYETAPPAGPGVHPVAMFGKQKDGESGWAEVGGVSHWLHDEVKDATTNNMPVNRNYTFHYIKFAPLEPGETYIYKVKGGAQDAAWSETYTFRAPRTDVASGVPTRVGMFGDMGVSYFNTMANLAADCAAGKIDAIVHMGDHAYNIGNVNGRRGDAYMNGYQQALASCPWVPIIGPVKILQRTFLDWTLCFSPAMGWIFIPAYCFALP